MTCHHTLSLKGFDTWPHEHNRAHEGRCATLIWHVRNLTKNEIQIGYVITVCPGPASR